MPPYCPICGHVYNGSVVCQTPTCCENGPSIQLEVNEVPTERFFDARVCSNDENLIIDQTLQIENSRTSAKLNDLCTEFYRYHKKLTDLIEYTARKSGFEPLEGEFARLTRENANLRSEIDQIAADREKEKELINVKCAEIDQLKVKVGKWEELQVAICEDLRESLKQGRQEQEKIGGRVGKLEELEEKFRDLQESLKQKEDEESKLVEEKARFEIGLTKLQDSIDKVETLERTCQELQVTNDGITKDQVIAKNKITQIGKRISQIWCKVATVPSLIKACAELRRSLDGMKEAQDKFAKENSSLVEEQETLKNRLENLTQLEILVRLGATRK